MTMGTWSAALTRRICSRTRTASLKLSRESSLSVSFGVGRRSNARKDEHEAVTLADEQVVQRKVLVRACRVEDFEEDGGAVDHELFPVCGESTGQRRGGRG